MSELQTYKSTIISDTVEIAAKTLLSVIPVGGPLISEVWNTVKSNAAQKRLQEWQQLVEQRLSSMEISLEDLGSNQNFASALFQATEAAIKTAKEEKRCYLANALKNSIDCDLDESVMMIFFNMINRYTTLHIKILEFFDNPQKYSNKFRTNRIMGSPEDVLFDTYPDLIEKREIVHQVYKELSADGLTNTINFGVTMTAQGMHASRTTALGKQFISFITLN